MPRRQSRILVVFLLFWSAVTLGFDGYVARKVQRQLAARSYPTVTGAILDSRVEEHPGDDGPGYAPAVRFAYEAGGRRRESAQWRYGAERTNIRRDAQKTVDAFSRGRAVTVYVNPADPSDAILAPGVHGSDLFFALFLGPFNAVMLGGWLWWTGRLAGVVPYRAADFEHVQVLHEAGVIRLRIHDAPPLLSAIAAFGGVCFASIFVVAFTWGFNAPVWPSLTALASAALAGVLTWARFRATLRSGSRDIVIDPVRRRIALPACITKGPPRDLPFDAVAGVEYEEGRRHQRGHVLNWKVRLRADADLEAIATQCDRHNAERLTTWLRDRLGASGRIAA